MSFASVSARSFGIFVSVVVASASSVVMSGGSEPVDLRPPDPGDEREVVVPLPLLLAEREELAERAVVDRVRVGRLPVLDRVEEPRPQPAVVGEEVVRPEALALAEPVDDVHRVRPAPLNPRELLGVEAELEHVSRLGPARELGVDDLVPAVRLPLEKVREPAPAPVDERRLVDDRRAVTNRLLGRGSRGVPADLPRIADRDDPVPERGEVAASCSSPLRRIRSAYGLCRNGRSISPRATASRSVVRCGQATKSLSADGERDSIAPVSRVVNRSPYVTHGSLMMSVLAAALKGAVCSVP